ncbi:tectonic-3 [Copidosoma floridanum]|uniref:tectonic-3 n=1 Tax=Copidosoma floridanum TaxID=29053 RepID=UPI0006C96F71|nr:tectonic-3 [Copidosoma floridanum]
MAELHLIGTIASSRNFPQPRLFCKWSCSTDSGWKIINGSAEGQTQECFDAYANEPVWDHPIDVHFATQTLQGSPKILLQVFCRDSYNRILFVAYGVCTVPLKPGFHSLECHTWKPIGDWQDRLKDKFLGTTLQLKSPDVLVNGDDRFELLTESMGTVKIDLYVLVRNFDKFAIFGDEAGDTNDDSCSNGTICANATVSANPMKNGNNNGNGDEDDLDDVNIEELTKGIFNFPGSTKTTTQKPVSVTTDSSPVNKKNAEPSNNNDSPKLQKALEERSKEKFCNCDLTIDVCDINCCCDLDCKDFHLKTFSHCVDRDINKEKDMWSCHQKPFFRHNETRFILEKVIDSLFCIASDNLPPMYSLTSHLKIDDEKSLRNVITNNRPSEFKWKLETKKIVNQEFNFSNVFRHGDTIWKIDKSSLLPFELPQAGFGRGCNFKKTVKYLEDWQTSCHQTNLNNDNLFLFPINFGNFSVVALPSKFNTQYLSQDCPNNVCRSTNVFYCSESFKLCKTNMTFKGFCRENVCNNVVKKVRYTFYHSGSDGIQHIEAHVHLANVSADFKQDFQVLYKWFGLNNSFIFERSGNPGYIEGKPIFVGTQMENKTDDTVVKYIVFNTTHPHLTLPMADRNGVCNEVKRYSVKFLENVKLKCSITVKTSNFSTTTCIKLQNRTFETLVNFMMMKNFDKINLNRQFISKSGNATDSNIDSWAKMFFEKIPQNVITAQIINNEIQCSGLVTSVAFDIVHSLISKPGTNNNHVILGIGVTFSQEVDLKWTKCTSYNSKNCIDTLQLDLVNYASFHDVSKPTRYYIAGGPNLDISLPYDFFYPFLSQSKSYLISSPLNPSQW